MLFDNKSLFILLSRLFPPLENIVGVNVSSIFHPAPQTVLVCTKGEGASNKCIQMCTRGEGADTLGMYAKQKIISFLQASCNIFICKKDFMFSVTKVAEDMTSHEMIARIDQVEETFSSCITKESAAESFF